MIRSRRALIALVLVPALLVGLALAVTATAAKPKPKSLSLRSTSLGRVIVDKHKRTLYTLSADGKNVSHCSGQCAVNWPPAKAPSKPTLGSGLKKSKLKVIKRSDGSHQLSYAGHPLYQFIGDTKPGDVNGEGITAFGGVWYAIDKNGASVTKAAAPAPAPAPPAYPGY